MTEITQTTIGCKPMPTRSANMETASFLSWLAKGGAEVGIPSNSYEVCRYRAYEGHKLSTHIVYRKESDALTWRGSSFDHYERFLAGEVFAPPRQDGIETTTYPTRGAERSLLVKTMRERLLERDGDECWFCGRRMGDDVTIEHLVPKSKKGLNGLANYALAHRSCNNRAGDMPLVQKIEMRQRMRGGKVR